MPSGPRSHLASDLQILLSSNPHQTQRELRLSLQKTGCKDPTKRDVNRVLYGSSGTFAHDGSPRPRRSNCLETPVTHDSAAQAARSFALLPKITGAAWEALGSKRFRDHEPRAWQIEAWAAWKTAGRRGVNEAVTGTGKTLVGHLCACDAAQRDIATLIVVPSIDLLNQWYAKLLNETRVLHIGRLGSGYSDSLKSCEILVSTVQSAFQRNLLPQRRAGSLIADELHRYRAEEYAKALNESCGERLGLSATFKRSDNGNEELRACL